MTSKTINKGKSFIYTLFLTSLLSTASFASAESSEQKAPSTYAVMQQQGPTCPFIPWVNLQTVQAMRQGESGKINLDQAPSFTKKDSYARFLPHIVAYDRALESLRQANGPYAAYEQDLKEKGIHDTARYHRKGKKIEEVDSFLHPLDKERRKDYTPYNIKHVDMGYCLRWIPILHNPKDDQLYFYNYQTHQSELLEPAEDYKTTAKYLWKMTPDGKSFLEDYLKLYPFSHEQIQAMGLTPETFESYEITYGRPLVGSATGYYFYNSPTEEYRQSIYYDVGSYQHLLFALGLDKNNRDIDETSPWYSAHQEFQAAMTENPANPYAQLKKENFFEYHLAKLFQQEENADLKEKVKAVLRQSFNKTWDFYEKSFDCYDSCDPQTRLKFSEKQDFLPGEDQMLAYFLSKEMRLLWSASIGDDAIMAVTELDQELGDFTLKILKKVINAKTLLRDAEKKVRVLGNTRASLFDVWQEVREKFDLMKKNELEDQKDFVTFSGHGFLISFDNDLIERQPHQNRDAAQKIGFTAWEQLYDKALTPFYRSEGKKESPLEEELL